MKTLWIEKKINYDGTQLRPLFAYEDFGILGTSCLAFRGGCEISFKNMKDLEDVRDQSAIQGSDMIHFILEIFETELWGAVSFQRLIAAIVAQSIRDLTGNQVLLSRQGDDLYWKDKKLSISIASRSAVSSMIHFAVNVSNQGTPVPTCSLEDFGLKPEIFARTLLPQIALEVSSILEATQKVRPL